MLSQQVIEQTIAKARMLFEKKDGLPPFIVRRKSLSNINSIIQPYPSAHVELVDYASSKDAKLLLVKAPAQKTLPTFFHEVICNQLYPVSNIILFAAKQFDDQAINPEFFLNYCAAEREQEIFETDADIYAVTVTPANLLVDGVQQSNLTVTHGSKFNAKVNALHQVQVTIIEYNPSLPYLNLLPEQAEVLMKVFKNMRELNSVIAHGDNEISLVSQLILMLRMMSKDKKIEQLHLNKLINENTEIFGPSAGKIDMAKALDAAVAVQQYVDEMRGNKPKELIKSFEAVEYAIRGFASLSNLNAENELVSLNGLSLLAPVRTGSVPSTLFASNKNGSPTNNMARASSSLPREYFMGSHRK